MKIWRIFILISSLLLSAVFWFVVWGVQAGDFGFVLVFGIPLIIVIPGMLLAQSVLFIVWFKKMDRRDKVIFFVPFLAIILEVFLVVGWVYLVEPKVGLERRLALIEARHNLKKALEKEDILICKKIPYSPDEFSLIRAECFNQLLPMVKDPAVCAQPGFLVIQETPLCYEAIAIQKNDIMFCAKIVGAASVRQRCFHRFIEEQGNQVCALLSSEGRYGVYGSHEKCRFISLTSKDECFIEAAITERNQSLCYLLTGTSRDCCLGEYEQRASFVQ